MELRRDHHSTSSPGPSGRPKRKPSSAVTMGTALRVKRRRVDSSDVSAASPAVSSAGVERQSAASTRRQVAIQPPTRSVARATLACEKRAFQEKLLAEPKTKSSVLKTSLPLFSRYADPSVQSPQSRRRSRGQVEGVREAAAEYNVPCGSSLSLSSPSGDKSTEKQPTGSKSLYIKSKSEDQHGVDRCSLVEHGPSPEMVEGDDILQTLLGVSTPRVPRRFPSEDALTDGEQRDREALRRRRQQLQREFSVMKEEKQETFDGFRASNAGAGGTSLVPSQEGTRRKRSFTSCVWEQGTRHSHDGGVKDSRDTVVGGREKDVGGSLQLMDEEVETDEETTESKIRRLGKVMSMNWRQFFMWLVSGAVLLCAMVVAVPFVKNVLKPTLPYCDSEWREVDEGTFVLADPADAFDRSKALQPFISNAAMESHGSGSSCQPCPVYGNCLNGSIISCASPYELQHGLCKESPEVQASLNQLAFYIRKVIVEKAAKSACDNVSIWNFLYADGGASKPARDVTAPVEVLLSDVQTFVAQTSLVEEAVPESSRDYVFNRALDMVLRDLNDISVTEDQSQLLVGNRAVPLFCRARHQLFTHTKLMLLAVALGTALVSAYRQFLVYRTKRELVDRFVKEVRFLLLDQTRRPDRFYPVDLLRDHLFAKQSFQDRAWLCKSVWPAVVTAVKKDSRISTRTMRVRGKDMIVWEWASSPSRSYRQAGSHQSRKSRIPKLLEGSGGNTRGVPLGRRKKGSRMSLP
uniref:Man1/Src1-like C-terminal domain-containing protein n=1 Tax=Peronospora matthiolae TaxID=2874970 RepID=A0AAV1TKM4_9STRA